MEYTKDVVFNVQYGEGVQTIKLKNNKYRTSLSKIFTDNKFIIITLFITVALISVDLWLISNFMNLLLNI